jgi:hypothetical protein
MYSNKVALFLTTFGGTFFLALFNNQGNFLYLICGALTIVGGFVYLHRVAKKLS